MRLIKLISVLLLIIIANGWSPANAQLKKAAEAMITADSTTSGNVKDIRTWFHQFAITGLTSPSKQLTFSSNPFAIMVKTNPDLALDHNYRKYQPLRRLNFSFGMRLDSSFDFNGFSSGLRYSIVDKRDATTSKYIFEQLINNPLLQQRETLLVKLQNEIDATNDTSLKKTLLKCVSSFLQVKDITYSQLDPVAKAHVDAIVAASGLTELASFFENKSDETLKKLDETNMDALKDEAQKDWLWTVGIGDTTYQDKFEFSNVTLYTEINKGLSKVEAGKNSFEFSANAAYKFSSDLSEASRNLNRKVFSAEVAINWVVRAQNSSSSFFELKLGSTYYNIGSTPYVDEDASKFTLNGTVRLKIFGDVWVPVELKYEPVTGNLFGLLNVKANFTALGGVLKNDK